MSEPNFFSTGSPFLDHPLLTPERTAAEVDFVLAQTKLPLDGEILDIGCGPGRHSIELARRGYRVVGIDRSSAMIKIAIERAADAGVQPRFWQTSGEEFSTEQNFEAAICLFTTLGQINSRDEITHSKTENLLLKKISQILILGGIFILEVPHKEWVVNNLKKSDRFGDDIRYTDIDRVYDPENNIVTETFTLVSPEGIREYLLCYRLYDLHEINPLLKNAGFEIIHTYGDFSQSPLTTTSPNILTVARLIE